MNERIKPAAVNSVLFNTILCDIFTERERQEQLRADGKFVATCATIGGDQMSEHECNTVLAEEFGEVARAILELDYQHGSAVPPTSDSLKHLRDELIQVAAVCAAWIERLDYYDITLGS